MEKQAFKTIGGRSISQNPSDERYCFVPEIDAQTKQESEKLQLGSFLVMKKYEPLNAERHLSTIQDFYQLCWDISSTVSLARSLSHAHNDIKPSNILVEMKENEPNTVKHFILSDFEFFAPFNASLPGKSDQFVPPEIFAAEESGGDCDSLATNDYFSLGKTLQFLLLKSNMKIEGILGALENLQSEEPKQRDFSKFVETLKLCKDSEAFNFVKKKIGQVDELAKKEAEMKEMQKELAKKDAELEMLRKKLQNL